MIQNRAPYTLSPIDRTDHTTPRLFTPPRPFTPMVRTPVMPTPIPLSSDTSHSSPIFRRRRRRRRRRITDSDDDQVTTVRRPRYIAENPFLDTEAVRSDDDESTGDEDDQADDDSMMNSFINDGSSGLVPEEDQEAMAMYRTSLKDVEWRKTWLDRLSTEKWELAAQEDGEGEDHLTSSSIMEEENISSFTNASDDFI
ncbi:hypothetical protein BC941DRAFT_70122 [Chlamydoabsidia padenii]|nr:hypothetical protein BC941DRAFT_70122 [Chlamydoabsidia padenii]